MKRKLTAILVMVTLCAYILIPAALSEIIFEPCYTHTRRIVSTISIESGVASCSGRITPISSSETRNVHVSVYLQRKDGTRWATIATWAASEVNETAEAGGTKNVVSGNSYRTFTVGTVSDEEGVLLERVTKASPTASY